MPASNLVDRQFDFPIPATTFTVFAPIAKSASGGFVACTLREISLNGVTIRGYPYDSRSTLTGLGYIAVVK